MLYLMCGLAHIITESDCEVFVLFRAQTALCPQLPPSQSAPLKGNSFSSLYLLESFNIKHVQVVLIVTSVFSGIN